jgi:hypothetical protein
MTFPNPDPFPIQEHLERIGIAGADKNILSAWNSHFYP